MLLIRNKRLRQLAGILETGNLLFVKLMAKNPKRARQFPGEVFRTYTRLAGGDRWACCSIFELFPHAEGNRIVLEHIASNSIETPLEQLACLALITRALEPMSIFEIGTFRGRTALNFALNSPKDCTVYTLDLPPEARRRAAESHNAADALLVKSSEPGADYEGKDVAYKIEQLFGDSQSFDFSPWYGAVDIVYVDGAHHYEAARSDTENALKIVRPGGCVIWDEFANYGEYNDVTRAVLDVVGAENLAHVENTQLAVYRQPLV